MGVKHGQVLGRKVTDGVIIFQYQSSCLFMVGELNHRMKPTTDAGCYCPVGSSAELWHLGCGLQTMQEEVTDATIFFTFKKVMQSFKQSKM